MMMDLISLGEALIDFFVVESGISLKSVCEFRRVAGGAPANVAAGAARMGLGAAKVMITDTSDFRLNFARECGIDFTLNPKKEKLESAILDNFGKDKADIIFECIGIKKTISQAISLARKGSKIIVVGVFGKKPCVDMGLVQDRELSLIGTLMYQKEDF